ncbi:MAG: hypothetical protein AVDCRST_MAG55-2950, partial [uncultured Rubrobacteraceae bacterium]
CSHPATFFKDFFNGERKRRISRKSRTLTFRWKHSASPTL